MKLTQFKTYFQETLSTHYSKEEAQTFLYLLIEHFLREDRFVWVMQPDFLLAPSQLSLFEKALEDLQNHRPIQYIIGETHFGSLSLKVREGVLIPRPETLELVHWVCEVARQFPHEIHILDIGTGSGCIPISLGLALPNAALTAIDVSEKAIGLATENAAVYHQDIAFVQADVLLLDQLPQSYDMIVSNPPYVRELEKKEMSRNVLDYEPALALYVPDSDPLIFYRKIAHLAQQSLKQGGALFFEINEYLGEETNYLLSQLGFRDCEIRKDIFGKDRMIKAIK